MAQGLDNNRVLGNMLVQVKASEGKRGILEVLRPTIKTMTDKSA